MATYTNRTCSKCGIRKPQPQMYQRESYVETGKSQTGISGATMLGVFSGDKKSGSQLRNWMFNNGQRTYKRKKQVWMCGVCAGVQKPAKQVVAETSKPTEVKPKAPSEPMSTTSKWLWGIFLLAMVSTCVNDQNEKKTGAAGKPTTTITQKSP